MKPKTFARTTLVSVSLLAITACGGGSSTGTDLQETDDSTIDDITLADGPVVSESTTPASIADDGLSGSTVSVSDVAGTTSTPSTAAVTPAPIAVSTPVEDASASETTTVVAVPDETPAELTTPAVPVENTPAEVADPVTVVDDTPADIADPVTVVDDAPAVVAAPVIVVDDTPADIADPVTVVDDTPADIADPVTVVDDTPIDTADPVTVVDDTPAEVADPVTVVDDTPAEVADPVTVVDDVSDELTDPVADDTLADAATVDDDTTAEAVESESTSESTAVTGSEPATLAALTPPGTPVAGTEPADDSSSDDVDGSEDSDSDSIDADTVTETEESEDSSAEPGTEEIAASDADEAPTQPRAVIIPTGITGSTILPATHGPIAGVPFDFADPFGTAIEENTSEATDTIPQAPGNLRLNLLSNNWIEIDWTPSVDDGEVVEYRIYRDQEHLYSVRGDQTHPMTGSAREARKYWDTTSFIDCNHTRFGGADDPLFQCADNAPEAGEEYVWVVTAIDDDGNESEPSNSITARLYDLEGGAPVALYSDIYLDGDDLFPFATNFARTENFLDQFALVFSEDFNGTTVDLNNWNTELVWTSDTIINGEQQYFVNSSAEEDIEFEPFKFTGSSMIIEAIPTPPEAVEFLPEECFVRQVNPRCQFLSGAIASHERFGLTYGYVEGRIRASGTNGALSSFYLFHRYPGVGNQFHSPEIDIIEYLGENPFGDEDAFQTYHYSDPVTGILKSSPTMSYKNPTGALFSDDFHTYGVLWEPGLVIWYIDGREIRRISGPQVGRQQMNIVAYLVAGSEWAPTPTDSFPLQMEIDYIRAYQRAPYVCNNPETLAAFDGDMAACQTAFNN